MTNLEMIRMVAWIEDHWPTTGAKSWEGWERVATDFSRFTAGSAMEACMQIFKSGARYAPGPSELMKAVQPIQSRRIHDGIDNVDRTCMDDHVWADPWPIDDDRHRVCVLCGASGSVVKCHHLVLLRRGKCAYCPEYVEATT